MPVPHQVYSYPVQIPHVFPSELPEKLNPQQSFDDKAVIEKFKNFNDTEPESSWYETYFLVLIVLFGTILCKCYCKGPNGNRN